MRKNTRIQCVRKNQPVNAVLFEPTCLALPTLLAGGDVWKLVVSGPQWKDEASLLGLDSSAGRWGQSGAWPRAEDVADRPSVSWGLSGCGDQSTRLELRRQPGFLGMAGWTGAKHQVPDYGNARPEPGRNRHWGEAETWCIWCFFTMPWISTPAELHSSEISFQISVVTFQGAAVVENRIFHGQPIGCLSFPGQPREGDVHPDGPARVGCRGVCNCVARP